MKRIFLLMLLTSCNWLYSQDVVNWSIMHLPVDGKVEIKAEIRDGWHLYSQHINNNVGPVPTTFTFMSSDKYTLKGGVEEPQAITKYDENFEATLNFFEKQVIFSQQIELKQPTTLEGIITYMVCNETMCMPPVDYKYKLELK